MAKKYSEHIFLSYTNSINSQLAISRLLVSGRSPQCSDCSFIGLENSFLFMKYWKTMNFRRLISISKFKTSRVCND